MSFDGPLLAAFLLPAVWHIVCPCLASVQGMRGGGLGQWAPAAGFGRKGAKEVKTGRWARVRASRFLLLPMSGSVVTLGTGVLAVGALSDNSLALIGQFADDAEQVPLQRLVPCSAILASAAHLLPGVRCGTWS